MYGLYSELLKLGLLVLTSHHHGPVPSTPSPSSNKRNLLLFQRAGQLRNSECILLFSCKLFTVGPTCLTSSPPLHIPFGMASSAHVCTHTQNNPHSHGYFNHPNLIILCPLLPCAKQ